MDDYKDIINLSRPISMKHKEIANDSRASQFAPFAALSTFASSIDEESRLTTKKYILSEEEQNNINQLLNKIKDDNSKPLVKITYYIKDKLKSGGSYNTIIDNIKFIDGINGFIRLNNILIKFDDIYKIEII